MTKQNTAAPKVQNKSNATISALDPWSSNGVASAASNDDDFGGGDGTVL